jgi:hypothetical protein
MHRVFIRRTTADISTFIRSLHTHTRAGQHSVAFFSSTSFLDIKAFNIERRIAMRPDSARSIGFTGRDFRDKFSRANTVVSTNREDARRDSPLPLVDLLSIAVTFFFPYNTNEIWYPVLYLKQKYIQAKK